MNLNKDQIEEIVDNLEFGFRCFLNLKTDEIKRLPNFDNWHGDKELWKEEIKDIDNNWDDLIEFEGFQSSESYDVMSDFACSVDDENVKSKLLYALNHSKPFRNFKDQLNDLGDYRQKWYDYKRKRYVDWVEMQIR